MTDSAMFQEAVNAIQEGQRARAKDLLSRLLKTNKNNPDYWLWMSSVVDTPKERLYCLQNVLRLDPENVQAKRGLILFGGLSDEVVEPVPPIRRNWSAEIEEDEEELTGFQKILANPVMRVLVFSGAAVIVVGIILLTVFGGGAIFGPRLTITPVAWTPTATDTPTITPEIVEVTPTEGPPPPLWMLLEATYTPVPAYVNTPHPRIEAYKVGIRAYERGDYESMLNFMRQAAREEPDSVDALFYVGEAYRLLGEYEMAIETYEEVLEIDPRFSPAYLARAKTRLATNPKANIVNDLDRAIEYDPQYGEAYLTRATYYLETGDLENALADLDAGEEFLSYSPQYYLLRAMVYLSTGEREMALENALEAHERDITLLPAYLVLGQAYLVNGMPDEAAEKIEVYGRYVEDDPDYHALLGAVYYEIGEDYEAALAELDQAIELDDESDLAYYYRGLTNLALEEYNDAINDLYVAKNLKPESFEYGIHFAIALYEDERYREAYSQVNAIERLAISDAQFGYFYYYKALAGIELAQYDPAKDALRALLELPDGVVNPEWVAFAEEYLAPPTETPTPTSTFTPSATATNTATFTITPSPTVTASPTQTPSPTTTPTATNTPTKTPTP